jgi:HNH endonuclease
MERQEFTTETMKAALRRQDNRCGSCGVYIYEFGKDGARGHAFGEWAEAHHIRHAHAGGDPSVQNCVVVCKSCHYSAHGGGNYRDNSEGMQGRQKDFPCYNGTKVANSPCAELAREMDEKFGGPMKRP